MFLFGGYEVGTDLSLKRLNVDSSSFVTDNSKIYYKISRSNKSIHNKMLNNNIILYPEMTDNCNTIKKLTFEEAYRKILRINSYYVQIFGVDYMNFLLQLVKTSSNYILILNRKETSYKFVSDLLIFLKNSSI